MSSYTENASFAFNDKSIRKGFIRKVYSILTLQLLITLAVIAFFIFHEPTKMFMMKNHWLFYISLIVVIVTMVTLICCGNIRRQPPMNIICLVLFTLAESFTFGIISACFNTEVVLMAVAITASITIVLTLFALQTKWDFTMLGGILIICFQLLLVFMVIAIFFPQKMLKLIFSSFGVLLFSIYLIHDTQLILGGDREYSYNPEEYIFAALNIYLDIISLFGEILIFMRN